MSPSGPSSGRCKVYVISYCFSYIILPQSVQSPLNATLRILIITFSVFRSALSEHCHEQFLGTPTAFLRKHHGLCLADCIADHPFVVESVHRCPVETLPGAEALVP